MATITGTSGSDSFTGTSGSDKINAGDGNDIFYYSLALNSNATNDIYTGGAGIDMVVLQFTYEQWNNAANQQQLTNYFNWLNTVKKNSSGEISNGLSSDFTFTFGTSTLKIQMMEQLGVMVDGRWLGGDFSVYSRIKPEANDDTATIYEDPQTGGNPDDGSGEISDYIENTITIDVLNSSNPGESDNVPSLVRDLQVIGAGSAYGSVTLVKADPADPAAWIFQYTMNSADFQYLRSGETATDSFQYQVTDMSGLSDTATVTITIVGSDDAAYIGNPDFTDLTEDQDVNDAGMLTLSGTITIGDPDHDQRGFNTSTVGSQDNKGNLVLQADGSYTYSIENSKVQSLGEGEKWIDMFAISSLDGTDKIITFVTTGVDDPTVISGDIAGLVKEKGSSTEGMPTAEGMLVANDADGPAKKFLAVQNNASTYGNFSVTENGAWTYTLDNTNAAVDALNEKIYFNQVDSSNIARYALTDYFWVESEDGVRQQVGITIEGSNDAVVISDPANNQLTEDSGVDSNDNLILSGYLVIADVDGPYPEYFGGGVYLDRHPIGAISLSKDGSYTYIVSNKAIQYLSEGEQYTDSFYTFTNLDTKKSFSFTITGVNDAAVIGDLQANQLTEDLNPDANNMLSLSGTLTISDVDTGEAKFNANVQSAETNLGSLTLSADGAYSYKIDNSKVQNLNAGQMHEDKFTISSVDGTTKVLKFVTNGVNERLSPVANTDVIWVSLATTAKIPVGAILANDSDPYGERLKILSITDINSKFIFEKLSDDGTEISFSTHGLPMWSASNPVEYQMSYKLADESGSTSDGLIKIKIAPFTINSFDNPAINIADQSGAYFYLDLAGSTILGVNANTINSGNGPSTLIGSDYSDSISGGLSIDHIYGGSGNDNLYGGSGNDNLYGGSGNDNLYGGDGDDEILGEDGDDIIYGEIGSDQIFGGSGDDFIRGGSSSDALYGELGSDVIYGDGDTDFLFGDDGDDYLYAGDGNDVIEGGRGMDKINTGNGDDIVSFTVLMNEKFDTIFNFDGVDVSGRTHDIILIYDEFGILADNKTVQDRYIAVERNGNSAIVNGDIKIIYDQSGNKVYFDSDGGDSTNRIALFELVDLIGVFDSRCILAE